MTTVIVHDATGANVPHLPPGPAAGYTTGTGGVPWTAAQWAAHPGAVRICQDPAATDTTADVLDVEQGAATPASAARWATAALRYYRDATRPGQRSPAIYASRSSLTAVTNALLAAAVTGRIGLWVANWNFTQAEAEAAVTNASGPFPVIGVQFANNGPYDTSVFSAAWLATVSGHPAPPPSPVTTWTEAVVQDLPTLSQGATGEDVRTLQGALVARHYIIKVDGVFGGGTASALRGFQVAKGLTGDGIAGPLTWPKLLGR